jgi:non-specific serine/threonine protein kinase
MILDTLLAACPHLTVLATSREALGLAGEQVWPVEPLPVQSTTGEAASASEAEQLFAARAALALPTFALTDQVRPVVAQLCRELDGLPLAIELAAARVRLLPPRTILQQLHQRFQVLAGGPRDAPAHHQSLRAAIDWSYQLLTADEQRLFRYLTVFAGGCTLAAAEAVCPPHLITILDGLAALAEKSLLYQRSGTSGESRFMLLVTLQAYARVQVEASGEFAALQQEHARHYYRYVRSWKLKRDQDQAAWLRHLDDEFDNLRATLVWLLDTGQARPALEMCEAWYWYWQVRGFWREGLGWLQAALDLPGQVSAELREAALRHSASLGWALGDFEAARQSANQALALCRAAGLDRPIPSLLQIICRTFLEQGEYALARAAIEECLPIARRLGNPEDIVAALVHQAEIAFDSSDYTLARQAVDEAVALSRPLPSFLFSALAWLLLGEISLGGGDFAQAQAALRESLRHGHAVGVARPLTRILATIAALLGTEPGRPPGDRLRAARLWSAVADYQAATGLSFSKAKRAWVDQQIAATRARLDPAVWEAAWTEGQKLTLDEAIALATLD